MIEIDGELFEDPCETIRMEKQIAALFVAQSAITQIRAIQVQPLFPQIQEGGIIVTPSANPLAGDWVLNAEFGEKILKDVAPLPSTNCPCIIGVDLGAPEGDRSSI